MFLQNFEITTTAMGTCTVQQGVMWGRARTRVPSLGEGLTPRRSPLSEEQGRLLSSWPLQAPAAS